MKSYYVVMESEQKFGQTIRKSFFHKAWNDVRLVTELQRDNPGYMILFFKELDVVYDDPNT